MLKVNYTAEALQQVHTGADENYGTTSMLRREKRRLKTPISVQSSFSSEKHRRETLLVILLAVYRAIDQDLKKNNYGFYDAYASKILAATGVRTRYEFLTELCKSCGVRAVTEKDNGAVMKAIDAFADDELLHVIRTEHQYLMLMLRDRVQSKGQPDLFSKPDETPGILFEKNFEWIPYVSGNTVRGISRRLVMRDFTDLVGIDKEQYGIEKDMYHQLFTGGNITTSTAFEDIALREKYVRLCPMVGLLGSAIGNMTIQGVLKVGGLRPVCREHGNGSISFWETIGRTFGTRSDSSKTERELHIIDQDSDSAAQQMKYEIEVFNTGTVFSGSFVVVSEDPVLISAFWRMVALWKEFGYTGGNSARGYGRLDIQIDVPQGAEQPYLEHIEKVKGEAISFFAVPRQIQIDVPA